MYEARLALCFMHAMLAQVKSKQTWRHRLAPVHKPVAIALGLPDRVGELKSTLEAFFTELEVKIIPAGQSLESLLEESQEFWQRRSQQVEKIVSTYLNGLKGKVDFVLLPLVTELEQYHRHFLAGVEHMTEEVSSQLKKLPKIINVPLPQTDVEAYRENLLRLGLLFTDDLAKVRLACDRAIAHELTPV
jgi:hypothetical protein